MGWGMMLPKREKGRRSKGRAYKVAKMTKCERKGEGVVAGLQQRGGDDSLKRGIWKKRSSLELRSGHVVFWH